MTSPAATPSPSQETRVDILVVGAGPAGIAAATAAAGGERSVLLLDDNHAPGGQIWRQPTVAPAVPTGTRAHALDQLARTGAQVLGGCRVFAAPEPGVLLAYEEAAERTHIVRYQKLILATGARERFLPFPGWTLPGVLGAGGLQALAQGGYPVAGKRIVVAGTGPLLLAAAAHLRSHGAHIVSLAEQAPARRLAWFALSLATQPARLVQAAGYRLALRRTPLLTGCWPVEALPSATGDGISAVRLTNGRSSWTMPCDLLACGFHLTPNTELASLLGITLDHGLVPVGPDQQTALAGIYCAGEPTGIAGVDSALVTGTIAGRAAAGLPLDGLERSGRRVRRFARRLAQAFALRPELRQLCLPATTVCRCEDVLLRALTRRASWTDAKLHTRCGMGPCQGRICGPAVEFLFGWQTSSVRPPLFPVPVHALITEVSPSQAKESACTCTGPA